MSLQTLSPPETTPPGNEEAWLSIGDLMSVLFLIFVLLFVNMAMYANQTPDVVSRLYEELQKQDVEVKVDPRTGAVTFKNSILFAEGSAELSAAGKRMLDTFVPIYSNVLFSEKRYWEEIASIAIEGQASKKGSHGFNTRLSTERALAASQYIRQIAMEDNPTNWRQMRNKLLVTGRGETLANQARDLREDRRVVIRLNFKSTNLKALFESMTGS